MSHPKWPMVPLGELVSKSEERVTVEADQEYPNFGIYNFGRGLFDKPPISGSTSSASSLYRARSNQFVYSRLFAFEGAYGLVSAEFDGHFVSNEFPLFECDETRLLPEYLGWYFRNPKTWIEVAQLTTGMGSRRQRLKPESFAKFSICVPPLNEQLSLLAKLERLSQLFEEVKELESELSLLSKTLAHSEFRIAEQAAEESGQKTAMHKLIESHDSGWSPQCEEFRATEGAWGVLKTTAIQWTGFKADANKAITSSQQPRPGIVVEHGDVLITRAGPLNRVGVACEVVHPPAKLMMSDKMVRLKAREDILPGFLALMLGGPKAQAQFRHHKTGLAQSQVNISRRKLLDVEIFVPSIPDQIQILSVSSVMRERTKQILLERSSSAKQIRAMMPSILDRAFKGEL